ncbi:MAG: Ig-like domain-containing protein [Bdellovibrionales bacterium]
MVTYQPAAGFYGVDTFTYTIEDPRGASDTATVTVHVMSPIHGQARIPGDN